MEMKSVPPLVALPRRHRLMAKPLMRPPKMQMSSTSSVMGIGGIRSVSRLVHRMTTQENRVNRLPMSLKLMTAGTALSRKLMAEKGTDRPQNRSATRWISRVRPLKPPGTRSPAWTKLFRLTAMMTEASTIRASRPRSSRSWDLE